MGLSHLLQQNLSFDFRTIGFAKQTRLYLSTSLSKKVHKEKKVMAVESYVRKYMEMHPGIFPKVSHVQSKVGGSWYFLKDILDNLKEKLTRNPQVQNHSSSGDKVDATAYIDATPHNNSPDNSAFWELQSALTAPCGKSENNLEKTELDKSGSVPLSKIVAKSSIKEKNLLTESVSDSPNLFQARKEHMESKELWNTLENEVTRALQDSAAHRIPFNKNVDERSAAELENGHMQSEETIAGRLVKSKADQKSYSKILSSLFKPSQIIGNKAGQPDNPWLVSEGDEMPASDDDSARQITGLCGLFKKMMDDQEAEQIMKKRDILPPDGNLEDPNEMSKGNETTNWEIEGLIGCIKVLPSGEQVASTRENIVSSRTGQHKYSYADHFRWGQSQVKMQKLDNVGKTIEKGPSLEAPIKIPLTNLKTEDQENFVAKKSNPSQCIPPTKRRDLNKTRDALSTEEVLDQNKVTVRFLQRTAKESDIITALKSCGDILKIEFPVAKRNYFKSATLYFKTREGMERALQTTDLVVKSGYVIVDPSPSLENVSKKISIPSLIGDPDAPAALVKNPTRTVAIKQLTNEISLDQIEGALAFCKSKISGFFLGSSSSVAYVEFETEEGKERAIAKHSIVVSSKRLFIHRIDIPRTTVVRVSNFNFLEPIMKLKQIFKSCGKVRCSFIRHTGIIDVHYSITEWPDMLKIINKLNGMLVGGYVLRAEPASIIPPDVLWELYSQPEERRRLKAYMLRLLQKLGENAVDKASLTDIASKFYGEM